MSKKELLKKMIEYKEITVDENLDEYCYYWELFDESLDGNKLLGWEEIKLIVRSFSNKSDYPYFLGILEDSIYLYLNENPDKIFDVVKMICKNTNGLYESYKILYNLVSENEELETFVQECLRVEDKERLITILRESPYRYSDEFKSIIYSI